MNFLTYSKELDIHILDYSGRISLKEGLRRIAAMVKVFLDYQKNGKILRILMDARGYIKSSPETHDLLAKISHEKFDIALGDVHKYMAVLNDDFSFEKNSNEFWFQNKQQAIDWLLGLE